MAVTCERVYNIAMKLIDEVTDSGTIENDPALKSKAVSFLNVLQTELLPNDVDPVELTSLNDELLLDDRLCITALPYGLASHLMITDDPDTSSFYQDRYEELRRKFKKAKQVPIVDRYNVLNGMR